MLEDDLVDPNDSNQIRRIQDAGSAHRSRSSNAVATAAKESGPTGFRIEVKGSAGLALLFKAPSHRAVFTWFNAIVANWSAGKAVQDPLTLDIPRRLPDFWRKNYIRASTMNDIADTGDIIFFSSP